MPAADIVIIGGGVIGSSIAFNLLEDGFRGRVLVIERDPSYQFASSALARHCAGFAARWRSRGGVREVSTELALL